MGEEEVRRGSLGVGHQEGKSAGSYASFEAEVLNFFCYVRGGPGD